MYDKDVLSLPSSAGSAHGPTESTDRSRTQCTTTLKTPCAPPPASFEPVSRESWETQFGKRTEKKKLALRPHRDTAFCWMMGWRDGGMEGWRDGGRRCRYNGGRWVLHTMPCTCGTGHKQRILGHNDRTSPVIWLCMGNISNS